MFSFAESTDVDRYRLAEGQSFAIWHNNYPAGLSYKEDTASASEWAMPVLSRMKFQQTAEHGEEQAELYPVEFLALAGIINWDEVHVIVEDGDSGRQAIRKALAKLYPNMTVSFADKMIRINTIPTTIPVDSVKHCYMGLAGLLNHKQAVEVIAGVMKQKLDPLFGEKVEEVPNVEKPSKTIEELRSEVKDLDLEDKKPEKKDVEGKGHKHVHSVQPSHSYIEESTE